MAKTARKEMIGRTISRQVGNRATTEIFKEHQSGKQKKYVRKRDGVGKKKRSGKRRPIERFVISFIV